MHPVTPEKNVFRKTSERQALYRSNFLYGKSFLVIKKVLTLHII